MSDTPNVSDAPKELPPLPPLAPHRRPSRARLITFGVGVVVGLVPFVVWNLPWSQAYLFTSDDRELGLTLYVEPSDGLGEFADETRALEGARVQRCQDIALEIYDHPIPALAVKPFPGYASPAEKEFYAACVNGPKSEGWSSD